MAAEASYFLLAKARDFPWTPARLALRAALRRFIQYTDVHGPETAPGLEP